MAHDVASAPGGLLAHAQQVQVLWLCSAPPRVIDLHPKLPKLSSSPKIAMVCKG